jgi:iron(III) transport system permease protein
VVLAFWSGLVALAIGAPMAWLSARTDLPGRRLIQSLIMASFVTPPFLGAFAWVMLAGPNAGYLNQLYRSLTGAEEPLLNIFSMPGLIFVVAIYTFPYVYIMIANTLGLIASDLEDAAAILGAGRLQVARTITLPMVLPAVLSGFILAVLQALALFGSPAILALPAGFHTVTTQMWSFFQYPPRAELAAAFSIPLLLATALLLLAQKKLLGRRGYAAVGGKGGQRRIIRLGPWRLPALAGCLAVLACAVFLPYGILLKTAFARAWAQPLTSANFTLENWSFTFLHDATRAAIVNTLELGVLTACVGAGLATLLAYVTNRKLVLGHQVLGFLAVSPVVIPGVVLAVALFVAYTRPPFLLYGTLWILFIAYLTKEMPVGYSQADATMRGIHPELEEAGRILGAGRLRVLREITAPLARSGIIATWCFVFIGVIRELSASIILFSPNTKVMSVVIFDLKEEGQFGAIAVLGIFMLVMTFAIVAAMQAVLGRDVMGARSSGGSG